MNSNTLSSEQLQLLCAACGPLSPHELDNHRTILSHCRGIKQKEGLYCISLQPDFDLLQEAWENSPLVREAAEALEQERREEDRPRNIDRLSYLPVLTARARHALLDGRKDDFLHFYGRIRRLATVEWKIWQERLAFWQGVLGPRLSGAEAVPQVAETQELRNLIYLRYAFHAPKAGTSLAPGQLPLIARLTDYLKKGQPLPRLGKKELEGTPGATEAAEAVAHMLSGDWGTAHGFFLKALGTGVSLPYKLAANLGGPMLIYAILNAIQAGAEESIIDDWLHVAANLLPPYSNPGKERDDLCGMLHSLRLLDQAANRGRLPETLPAATGELTCFPLLLGYSRLPARLRASLSTETLSQTIRKLEHAGLFLFARYGRNALQLCGLPDSKAAPGTPAAHPGESRPLLSLRMQDDSLHIRVQLELSASPEYLLTPGEGSATILVQTPGGSLLRHREREEEEQMARELWSAYAILEEGQSEGPFHCCFPGMEKSLQALSFLTSNGAPIHWQGAAIKLLPPPVKKLSLTCSNISDRWLELDARVTAGGMVWPLADLLAAFRFRSGLYLPISRNLYLPLPEHLARQLKALEDYTQTKAHKVGLSPAALPALAEECGEAFPAGLRHYVQRLHVTDTTPPEGLEADLRPYQKEGYSWLLSCATAQLGGCLADDMGLGKTLQMLALLLKQAKGGPSLIIAPLSVLSNWEVESRRHAPGLRTRLFNPAGLWKRPQSGEVVLASYGQLVSNLRLFELVKWNIIALDEAQAIKNPKSHRTVAVQKLRAKVRFCLTGTPIENGLMDLWSIMNFLNPGLLGTQSDFLFRYNAANPDSRENLRRLVAPLILRRNKAQVLPQLAGLTELVSYLDFTPRERSLYEACCKEARENLSSPSRQATHASILAELTRLRRLCCHPRLYSKRYASESSKITALAEILYNLKEAGHRALVFSQFTDVLDLVEPRLRKSGISYLRLDGSLSATKRNRRIREFQNGEADTFLISLKAGGTGLNLTAADYVILLDPWWNPAVEDQAIGRSHRLGQQRAVTVYRLIVRNTVEERILAMHRMKKDLTESLISEGAFSIDELMTLLE